MNDIEDIRSYDECAKDHRFKSSVKYPVGAKVISNGVREWVYEVTGWKRVNGEVRYNIEDKINDFRAALVSENQLSRVDSNPFSDIILYDQTGGNPSALGECVLVELTRGGWVYTAHRDVNSNRLLVGYAIPVTMPIAWEYIDLGMQWGYAEICGGKNLVWRKPQKDLGL